jgi:hypothetical protein
VRHRHDQPRRSATTATSSAVCDDRRAYLATHNDLEIETLVSTISPREQTPKLTAEQRAIAALCHEILSIAEVSARLHLSFGVIRILFGDMADEHLVMVHRPAQAG